MPHEVASKADLFALAQVRNPPWKNVYFSIIRDTVDIMAFLGTVEQCQNFLTHEPYNAFPLKKIVNVPYYVLHPHPLVPFMQILDCYDSSHVNIAHLCLVDVRHICLLPPM